MPSYYPKFEHSKKELDRAGDTLINPNASEQERDHALTIINNWRVSHNFPLNTFQMRLRKLADNINHDSLVAQRIKRLASIKLKLERFKGLNMGQIQDIGGCRAIMKNIVEVDQLVNAYMHESRGIKHKRQKVDDYILNPKPSGYRGVHLIYKYASEKRSDYDNMRIEIQVRTLVQHAWATAVEIVGTFTRQSLKSSMGEQDWLRFFALMSSVMAISEGKPIVPGTPDNYISLRDEIRQLVEKLDVISRLEVFRQSIEVIGDGINVPNAHYYLLELDPKAKKLYIKPYKLAQLSTASSDLLTLEKRILNENRDAVLVSASSIKALPLAYPNYYLDTDLFLTHLKQILSAGDQLELLF